MKIHFTFFLLILLAPLLVTAQVVQVGVSYTFVGPNGSCAGGGPAVDLVATPQAKGSSTNGPNATNAGCDCANTGDDFNYTQYGINGTFPDMHDLYGHVTFTTSFGSVGVNTTSVYTQNRTFRKWWKAGYGCVTEGGATSSKSYMTVYVEAGLTFNPPANICPTSTPIDLTTWTNKMSGRNKNSMTYTLDGGPSLNVATNPIVPSSLTPGIHNIVITYPFDTPDNTVSKAINIATFPTSTISASFPENICAISGQTVDLSSFVSNAQPAGSTVTFNCVPGGGNLCPTGVLTGSIYNPFAQGGNSFSSKIEVVTTSPQGCVTTVERIIKVGQNFSITPGATINVCKDAANIALGGSPSNGSSNGESGTYTASWSGTGVVTGTHFSPSSGSVVGGGSYILTYTVNSNMGCVKTADRTVNVNPTPSLSVGGIVPHIADCASGNIDLVSTYIPRNNLTPVSTGLTWSSNNATVNSKISGGILSLTGIPMGNYNITFSYINGFGCSSSYTISNGLAINTGAIEVPAANNATNCGLGLSTTLSVLSPDGAVSYDWFEDLTGGSSIFTGTSFTTPALSTSRSYYVAARKASCVSSRKQVNVTVINTDIEAGGDYSSCTTTTGNVNLSGINNPTPAGGTWSGPGVTSGNFNGASLANNSAYELVYTVNQSGCISRDTILATLGFSVQLTYSPSSKVYPGNLIKISHNYPTATKTIWTFGDGQTLEALTGSHYYYDFGFKTISVYIKQAGGCENTFTIADALEVLKPDVITQTEKEVINNLHVYPVPFKQDVMLELETDLIDVNLRMIDMSGRVVLSESRATLHKGINTLFNHETGSLSPGLYLLELGHSSTIRRIKLVKQ